MKINKQLPRLIHFFGPDGAGKSTHVEILVDILCKQGISVKKCWVRAHHTIAYLLWRFFVKIGFYREVLNPFGAATRIPAVDRNKLLRFFWTGIEFIGVIPHILKVHYYLRKGYVVVAERYILDTITTIAYFLNDINFVKSYTSKILLRFIPTGTAFIFLDADYDTIYQRRAHLYNSKRKNKELKRGYGITPAIAVEPKIFIDFQRTLYRVFSKTFNSLVIDTSYKTIEQTSILIKEYLGLD